MRKLGETQQCVLETLVGHHTYPGGWYWDNHSQTVRVLDSLVRRGLAVKDERGTYRPTDAGRALIGPAGLYRARKPAKPIAQPAPHEFVRRGDVDGGYRDRECVECGLDERNPVHR